MISPSFKLVVTVIIICSLLLSPLSIARAFSGWLIILKEFGLDVAARIITRIILTKLSDGMVGKMLTLGRNPGEPVFIQDWRIFLSTAQYRGEDITRGLIADAVGTTICPYMGPSIARIFNAYSPISDPYKYRVDSLQYYKLRNRCTLPSNFNVALFRNDFSGGGGWAAWDKLIQPQNSFYGVSADSDSELGKQRVFEQGIDTSESVSGGGNTSAREPCVGVGMNRQCTVMGIIITPGTIFSQAEAATINKEMDWLVSADELSEIIANLTASVLNRLEDYAAGAVLSGPPAGGDYGGDALGQARQDCINSCIVSTCPAALAACNIDESNRPCTPADPDPRNACVSDCQAKGCQ